MTTKTKTDEARIVAQKMVDLELSRKDIVDEIKDLKSQFETLIEEGADSRYDLNNGSVFIQESIDFSVPDGLLNEIQAKVKNPEKLSQDLIDTYFNPELFPTRRALKELRNSQNPDLSSIVVQKPKSSIKIKVG